MNISYKLIGEGVDGYIYNPPLSEHLNEYNMVGKVGNKTGLLNEYNMLDILPEYFSNCKNIHKPSYFYLTNVNSMFNSLLEEEFVERLKSYPDLKISQLIIPFISGITLNDYFFSFKFYPYKYRVYEQDYPKNISTKIISDEEFQFFLSLLLSLYLEIIELNKMKIYHNDINVSNIMYNNNELILIDWAKGTIDKEGILLDEDDPESKTIRDIDFMKIIFEEFIYHSIQNKNVYTLLKIKGFNFTKVYEDVNFNSKKERAQLAEIIHNQTNFMDILNKI